MSLVSDCWDVVLNIFSACSNKILRRGKSDRGRNESLRAWDCDLFSMMALFEFDQKFRKSLKSLLG